MSSFYDINELNEIGFKSLGSNILISKKASIYGANNISIGSNVRIDDFCLLTGSITLGNYIHISAYSSLVAGSAGILLEDFSGLSSKCSIFAVSDDYSGEYLTNPMVPDEYKNIIGKKVTLKKHTIIGSNSIILPGVTIGEGASVGAHSLILKDLDPWGIYAGIPAKKIKDRSKNLLKLEKDFLNNC